MSSLIQPWKLLLGEVQEHMLPSMNPPQQERDSLTGQPPGLAVWNLNKIVKKADVDSQAFSVAKIPFRREASATDPPIAEPNAA